MGVPVGGTMSHAREGMGEQVGPLSTLGAEGWGGP